ncbi:MAG: 5'-methylthioadenosine/adenosylhomocysteine nucleosidase [Treponema sp.]|nr:5'-methylthioadenosine/adenosylhomocysteine nucleosidase [Candidatus Treponema caballi]
MKIGLIGAMEVEVQFIRGKLANPVETVISGIHFFEGELYGKQVVVTQCGVGKVNAALCTELLINSFGVTHVINTGVAGGLDSRLSVMDIVVSTDAVHHDMDAVAFGYAPCQVPGIDTVAFPADEMLIKAVESAYQKGKEEGRLKHKVIRGRVASGDVFVNSADKKKKIIELCGAACCEMEGAAVAQVCYLNKVPFAIIRCVSDLAEHTDEVYKEEEAAAESSYITDKVIEVL